MWVVFEVDVEHRRLWAWCRTAPAGHAGFDDVTFTEPDGVTLVDVPDPLPPLGAVLFTTPHVEGTSS